MNRPLVEQEIAFVMGARLQGPSVNAADVVRATDFVLPAFEIVDSRYTAGARRCSSTASRDGASCGFVVLGGNPARLSRHRRPPGQRIALDQRRHHGDGTAQAVMGNPVNAVAWLANKLAEFEGGDGTR